MKINEHNVLDNIVIHLGKKKKKTLKLKIKASTKYHICVLIEKFYLQH